MKGAFIENRYYVDDGINYAYERLSAEFSARGVTLDRIKCPITVIGKPTDFGYDFAILWNKDVSAALEMQSRGIPVYNSPLAIEICDDKQKTAAVLSRSGVKMPVTVFAPHAYLPQDDDEDLFREVDKLGYPVVIKESRGSQGKQVYLAGTKEKAKEIHRSLGVKPHLFQSFEGDEKGSDIRVYVVGGKAVGWGKRRNTTSFRSNVAAGGKIEKYDCPDSLKTEAERIAATLELSFGSVDFLPAPEPVFIEANSSAYLKGIESLGFDVAGEIAKYVLGGLRCNRK